METITKICKLSHKQFRAMLKKFRRKKKRQQLAKEREEKELLEQKQRESSPGYKEREEEMRRNLELYEQFEEREQIRKHKMWLLREEQAQEAFRRKQKQLEMERIKREEERKRILEEFEKQQYVENEAVEETKRIKSQKEVVRHEQYFYMKLISKYIIGRSSIYHLATEQSVMSVGKHFILHGATMKIIKKNEAAIRKSASSERN